MAGLLSLKAVWPLMGAALLSASPALAQPASQQVDKPSADPASQAPVQGAEPAAKAEPKILIAEVAIEGLQDHPERERLELAAYAAMAATPGSRVTRNELQTDLSAIYASGWFSDVRIQPVDGPLGVRLVVVVVANPVLQQVKLDPADLKLPEQVVKDTFAADYGKTLNLNTLQTRMQELQRWYADQGYSLARITGPSRVSPEGVVELLVRQGTVEGVEVQFLNKEGSATNDKGEPIRGKTKPWVVTREVSLRPGQVFNRRELEEDIKRIYGTGLFSDVKVTLKPVPAEPGKVVILLGIVEQSSGSLSGGLGYSQSQGAFGQIQLNDSNLFGRAWDLGTNISYGQFGGLGDITFTDPWLKDNKYRTSFRARIFFSREVPQLFQSENAIFPDLTNASGRDFDVVTEFTPRGTSPTEGSGRTNFDTVAIQRVGANVQFVRPLNGGNPYKKAPWNLILSFGGQEVTPMDFSGSKYNLGVVSSSYGSSGEFDTDPNSSPPGNGAKVICLAFNCASENQLVSFRVGATYSTLNDPRNPTKGNFLSLGTEQFISIGENSPTFNRVRGSFTHY
ncbi:MAG: BamA/TamA family outer membrane protein, partial [Prochlorococcaceae cyanobacterium MAG_34]|nr:BamA/TamA family outer membrane protein [Prochlorococcaceae cyanobacterium MAG_34]